MAGFGKIWRRIAKIIVILYIIVICLPVFVGALIRTPLIQKYLVGKISNYLSEELKTDVTIRSLNINFFLNIELEDVKVKDQRQNILFSADKIIAGLQNFSLKRNVLFFSRAGLDNPVFNLRQYKGEQQNNLQFIIDYFSSKDTSSTERKPWKISFNSVYLKNAEFSYYNENREPTKQGLIDFNNLHIRNIYLLAGKVRIDDVIKAQIKHLSLSEQSGLEIDKFASDVTFSKTGLDVASMILKTGNSDLKGHISFLYSETKDFNNFIHKVTIQSDFNKSVIDFRDISFFATGVPENFPKLFISGEINGTIANLSTRNFKLEAGMNTHLGLNCSIMGLPDINETFFDLNISDFRTDAGDIVRFMKNFNINPERFKEVNTFARFDIKGNFIGFLNSFYADFSLNSEIGGITAKMSFKETGGNIPAYNGTLQTTSFDVGRLMQNDKLGIISSFLEVSGQGTELQDMNIQAAGTITELGLNNYSYSGITLNAVMDKGLFDGKITMNDPNVLFRFDGNIQFATDIPVYSFNAQLANAQLNTLNFSRNQKPATLIGKFVFKGTGDSPDNFKGTIEVEDFVYSEGPEKYKVQHIRFSQDTMSGGIKRMTVESDIVDGFIEGNYQFNTLGTVFEHFISEYISGKSTLPQTTSVENAGMNISFGFNFREFDPISKLFIPKLKISPGTELKGTFSSLTNSLFSNLSSGEILYDNIRFKNPGLNIETFSGNIYLTSIVDRITYNDSLFIENFIGSSIVYKDNINFSLYWDNYDTLSNTSGDIKGYITFPDSIQTQLTFLPSHFTYEDRQWNIQGNNRMSFAKNIYSVEDFVVLREDQEIRIHGIASSLTSDEIQVQFSNFALENIDVILKQYDISVEGNLNGKVVAQALTGKPLISGNLTISDFVFEDRKYGDVFIFSEYNNSKNALYSEIRSSFSSNSIIYEPLLITGNYYFDKPGNELDFKCKLAAFDLKLIEPFLAGQLKIIDGKTSGEITVKGDQNKPDVNGSLWFMRAITHVNYLNTIFVLKDTIYIGNDRIYAKDFQIADARGKTANADIMIRHSGFSNFNLDIRLKTDGDFVFMNTGPEDNEDFYGTIVAEGFVQVTGKPDDVFMNVSARTEKGTQFFLPMDATSSVYENNFITFISKSDSTNQKQSAIAEPEQPGFRMNLDLEVTPDAEMQIIFDPKIGDIMRGKARGNLRLDFDINGDFFMFGELELVEGDYLFTLENVINKKFFIYPGGSIKWQGDPYNALIDISTYYPIRTRLFDLVSHIDSSEIYRKKIPVNLELNLKNNLMTPDITFNISLPQADENTRNIMKSAISSDQEMNRQVFSLLVLNSFVQPEASFTAPITQGMGTTSLEFVSNQFSNWLSQISKDFDIGVNYRPGTELTTEEVEMMFSTQVFNDRVRIEGNVGMGGNQVGVQRDANQLVLGDVSVEYRLTPDGRIYMRAFNRSNTIDVVSQNSPYTQGVSLFFRKDFDRLTDLFRNERKNKRNQKK